MQDVETDTKMVCPPIHPCNIPLFPGALPVLTLRSLIVCVCLMVQCEMFLSGRLGHLDGLAKEEKSQNANFNLIDKLYQISHHIPNTQQHCFSKHLTSTTLMYPSNMGILATQWTGVQ